MNKYTLSFVDKAFETKFQIHSKMIYRTVYYFISIGFIGCLGLIIIYETTQYDLSLSIILKIAAIIYLIGQFFLVLKYENLTLLAIISNNIIAMTSTFDMINKDPNLTFLVGQNLMCYHSIILLILDFKIAALNNFILLIWRIAILTINVDEIYYADILAAIFIQTTLMICLYIKSKAQRELFLLYMKDQSWEKQIPEIVSKPMFIFTFDNENLKFLSKLSVPMEFLKDIENPLEHLLRHTYYLGNTLEHYIFKKIKSYESNIGEETEILKVKYKKESKIIKLTKIKLNIVTMIVTVEDEDLNIQILKKEQNNTAEDWKRTIRQSLLNQIKVMRNLLKTKDKYQLQQILIQYSQLILLQQSKRNILQTVELTKLIRGIIHEFRIRRIKLITYEPIYIQTYKTKMLILLMQITKQLLKQDKLILIELTKIDQNVVMTIKQVQPIQMKYKSQILQKIQNELIESINYMNKSIIIFNYLELTIKYYLSPQIPFQ